MTILPGGRGVTGSNLHEHTIEREVAEAVNGSTTCAQLVGRQLLKLLDQEFGSKQHIGLHACAWYRMLPVHLRKWPRAKDPSPGQSLRPTLHRDPSSNVLIGSPTSLSCSQISTIASSSRCAHRTM